jgi:hypothetical protein
VRRGTDIIMAIALAMTTLGIVSAAHAQDFGASPAFRVDAAPREFSRSPALEGYVHNGTSYRITNVRLKVEILDGDGGMAEEATTWVVGDIAAGGKGYFVVRVAKPASPCRVTVLSFDIVSGG